MEIIRMNCDCAFYIGTTHEVCQDYAIANEDSIVVSDGCSGSLMTDVGSRVLSITASNKIKEINSLSEFDEKECILLARPSVKMLNISYDCLDATLLASSVNEDYLDVMCCGDGVIVIKMEAGHSVVIDCAYSDSYPFYINYLCSQNQRYEYWMQNHNKRDITITYLLPNGEFKEIANDHEFKMMLVSGITIDTIENKTLVKIPNKEHFVKHISILSDGVHSFYETIKTETSRYNRSVDYLDVLKELLSFKNYNKAFVQRRINKFRKDCVKKNWANADDVSLATIYLGE
jgi:hypothetical protein